MDSSLQESAGQVVRLTTQTLQEEAKLLTEEALVPLDKAVQSAREHFLEESARARQSYEEDAQKAAEAFSLNIADRMESALGQWRSASEQETSNFKAAQFEFEKSVQARLEDYQKQLADRSTARVGWLSDRLAEPCLGSPRRRIAIVFAGTAKYCGRIDEDLNQESSPTHPG